MLRGMHADNFFHPSIFEKTLRRLNDEWKGLVTNVSFLYDFVWITQHADSLQSTLLINANITLSGISGVKFSVQIFSYVSVALSTTSIIIGLLLVRQTRMKSEDVLSQAVSASDCWQN